MAKSPVQVVKEKPVASIGSGGVVALGVVGYLTAHGFIPAQWAPYAALALGILIVAAIHALVSPYEKVKHWAETEGLMSDADFARLESMLDAKFGLDLEQADVDAKNMHTDLSAPPDGMSAGDPTTTSGA